MRVCMYVLCAVFPVYECTVDPCLPCLGVLFKDLVLRGGLMGKCRCVQLLLVSLGTSPVVHPLWVLKLLIVSVE